MMLEDKYLKLSWIKCKLQEKIQISQCFKRSEHFHTATECKSDKTEAGCFIRGQTDYVAKSCTKTLFCTNCKLEGDRSDQMTCPVFRKLVNAERDRREATTQKKVTNAGNKHLEHKSSQEVRNPFRRAQRRSLTW